MSKLLTVAFVLTYLLQLIYNNILLYSKGVVATDNLSSIQAVIMIIVPFYFGTSTVGKVFKYNNGGIFGESIREEEKYD